MSQPPTKAPAETLPEDDPNYLPEMRRPRHLTIVIKLGTSSICDERTHEPLLSNLSLIVETCVRLRRQGHRVILVSSGAIGIGMRRMETDDKPWKRPKELEKLQAIAAIGQCRLMALWDELFKQLRQPIAQILLTRNDIADRTQYENARRTFMALFEMEVIPIVNENDTLAVTEIKFGDNDTLSAITAGLVHADYLFLMTDVDCLYDKNPRTNPDAKPIEIVDDISTLEADVSSAGSGLGTGGMATKLTAARLATSAGVTTIIARSSTPSKIFDIVAYVQALKTASGTVTPSTDSSYNSLHHGLDNLNIRLHTPDASSLRLSSPQIPGTPRTPLNLHPAPLHTRFTAKPRAIKDRYFWILHGLKPHGTLIIDEGAYRALTRLNKAGLLPVGVIDVHGSFAQQECVSISVARRTENSGYEIVVPEVGRALVNYASSEIARIKGEHSERIADIIGYAESDYVAQQHNTAFFDDK